MELSILFIVRFVSEIYQCNCNLELYFLLLSPNGSLTYCCMHVSCITYMYYIDKHVIFSLIYLKESSRSESKRCWRLIIVTELPYAIRLVCLIHALPYRRLLFLICFRQFWLSSGHCFISRIRWHYSGRFIEDIVCPCFTCFCLNHAFKRSNCRIAINVTVLCFSIYYIE